MNTMNNILSKIEIPNLLPYIPEILKTSRVQKALLFTGVAFVSYNLLSYASKITSSVFTAEYNLICRYGVDSWALVTGASDGVGKEFALQLANRGFNIILVAKNEGKLGVVRSEITMKHPNIRVRIVLADFSKSAEEGFAEKILDQVKDLDISLLVNNVGQHIVDQYHLISTSDIAELVLVNCLSQALMTRIFLPKLLGRVNDKVKSGIITMSSMNAMNPTAYSQLYSSSKVFNDYLSQGLASEYPQLDFISLKPFFVGTRMAEKVDRLTIAITPTTFVNSALKHLGHDKTTHGHWMHQLCGAATRMTPRFILDRQLKQIEWQHAQNSKEGNKRAVKEAREDP